MMSCIDCCSNFYLLYLNHTYFPLNFPLVAIIVDDTVPQWCCIVCLSMVALSTSLLVLCPNLTACGYTWKLAPNLINTYLNLISKHAMLPFTNTTVLWSGASDSVVENAHTWLSLDIANQRYCLTCVNKHHVMQSTLLLLTATGMALNKISSHPHSEVIICLVSLFTEILTWVVSPDICNICCSSQLAKIFLLMLWMLWLMLMPHPCWPMMTKLCAKA